MSILPGELGCLTKSTNIRMTTMHGKRITTPSGTEMLEFPFNRSGRRKKAKRDNSLPERECLPFSSVDGSWSAGVDGSSLEARRRRSMVMDSLEGSDWKLSGRRV